jgi:hypothetical protein
MNNQKQVILHIGQTKTGTTSIQDFLHKNQKDLEKSNILYARRPGQCPSHRYLYHLICASISELEGSDFHRHHTSILKNLFEGYNFTSLEQYWGYFTDSLFNHDCNISIISEELLWELGKFKAEREFKLAMIQMLADALHQFVNPEEITIVVALRHHAEWLESWHNQMVKDQGNQTKIKPFLKRELEWGSLNYAKNLNDWRKIFPNANFKVVDFKGALVTSRPIGITFLQEAGVLDYLKLQSIVNFIYPSPLQESIHPLLHAYLIRNKPPLNSLNQYNLRLKKANKIVGLLVKLNDLDRSYTLINSTILKICSDIYENDSLENFGIQELKSSFAKKVQVPRILPKVITKPLDDVFANP